MKVRRPCWPASKIGPNCRRLAWATLMGEPAAFWPRGGAWSTGPPHFHPLDATGSTAQASRRRFGLILEPGQQGLLTFIFRAPCSPRWHCFEEVRFWGAIPHLVLGWASRRRPPRWEWLLYWGMLWPGVGPAPALWVASRSDASPASEEGLRLDSSTGQQWHTVCPLNQSIYLQIVQRTLWWWGPVDLFSDQNRIDSIIFYSFECIFIPFECMYNLHGKRWRNILRLIFGEAWPPQAQLSSALLWRYAAFVILVILDVKDYLGDR